MRSVLRSLRPRCFTLLVARTKPSSLTFSQSQCVSQRALPITCDLTSLIISGLIICCPQVYYYGHSSSCFFLLHTEAIGRPILYAVASKVSIIHVVYYMPISQKVLNYGVCVCKKVSNANTNGYIQSYTHTIVV